MSEADTRDTDRTTAAERVPLEGVGAGLIREIYPGVKVSGAGNSHELPRRLPPLPPGRPRRMELLAALKQALREAYRRPPLEVSGDMIPRWDDPSYRRGNRRPPWRAPRF